MTSRYPGYDVLAKRQTPSWNEATRKVIDRRLGVHPGPRFFSEDEWRTLSALCHRIIPQPGDRPQIPIASYIDEKMFTKRIDGYRFAPLLPQGEAWKAALAALDAEARDSEGAPFHSLPSPAQDALIRRMEKGELTGPLWRGMPSSLFFAHRVLHDVISAYYAHPIAWNEMGFGGPASPRGYVRLDADRRDPWEAVEARPGHEAAAEAKNRHVG